MLRNLFLSFTVAILYLSLPVIAATGTPFKVLSKGNNIIVWQNIGQWLLITEDSSKGRFCYCYDPMTRSRIHLKNPQPGAWIPLGSAIKWLMYECQWQGLSRLMAHDVDWHAFYIAVPSMENQLGCAMVGDICWFGQYRREKIRDHYPVDIMAYNVKRGFWTPFLISDSEKTQFAHDGKLLVYRFYDSPSSQGIAATFLAGGGEFIIANGNYQEPATNYPLVTWFESTPTGSNVFGKNILSGEIRLIAQTTQANPRPEAGIWSIYWQDRKNSLTGLDIYGYEWKTGKSFIVTNIKGDQYGLRVCDNLVTWVSGIKKSQILWVAKIL